MERSGGKGESEHEPGQDSADPPVETWEVPELRLRLSREIQSQLQAEHPVVAVSIRKLTAMAKDHPADQAYFGRMGEIVQHYDLWGLSRTSDQAVELYKQLDNIWFTVVIYRHGGYTSLNSVGTMHRIERRKVESRRRKYLRERKR